MSIGQGLAFLVTTSIAHDTVNHLGIGVESRDRSIASLLLRPMDAITRYRASRGDLDMLQQPDDQQIRDGKRAGRDRADIDQVRAGRTR